MSDEQEQQQQAESYLSQQSHQQNEQLNKMHGQVGLMNNQLNGMVLLGRVIKHEKGDPEPPKKTVPSDPYPSVLVQIGGSKKGTFIRSWMPWIVSRAGVDTEWWQPQPNEQVLVLSPSGNPVQGIIIGSLYKNRALNFDDKGKAKDKIPVAKNSHIHARIYQDGSRIEYDNKKHKLNFTLKDKAKTSKPQIQLTSELIKEKGKLSISLNDGGNVVSSITLNAVAKGEISIKSGKNSASEVLLSSKGSIILKTKKKNILTINPDGEVKIEGDVTIKGDVDIKGDVKIKGKVKLDGSTIDLIGKVKVKGSLDVT